MKIVSTLFCLILSITASTQVVNKIMRLTYSGGRQEKEAGLCGMNWAVENSPRIPLTGNHPVRLNKDRYKLSLPGRSAGIYFLSQEKSKVAAEEVIVTAKCTPRANNPKINNDSLAKELQKGKGPESHPFYVKAEQPAKPYRMSCHRTMPDDCQPLWVVDGVIKDSASISKINPNDIENIEILKGNTATAIFGVKGANGVILIRLKMRYDKISIKDALDKTPIAKATISFVRPERKDTLRYIADDSGGIVSNSLSKLEDCEMIVSATGYKNDTRTFKFDKIHPLNEVLLTRDIKECSEVIVSSIICRRKGCGGRRCWVRRSKEIQIPVNDLAISFNAYPNPAKRGEAINFQFASGEEQLRIVRVITPDGKILLQQTVKAIRGLNRLSLNAASNWVAGVYFIQLLYENGRMAASGKIVVQ